MKSRAILVLAALAAAAACSGNFATGTGMPQQNPIPPVSASGQPAYDQKGMTQNGASPNPSLSPGVANAGSFSITDAQSGFTCPPTIDGYGCKLQFNLPPPTPTPSPTPKGYKARRPTPTPSPTPTPTPTPTADPSGSPTPKPTPTPGIVALKAEALPKDAPALVHTPPGTLDTVPLVMVHLTPTSDFTLDGYALASFTLPKDQVAERGFAVQLFKANVPKRGKTTYQPIWTFDKSTLTQDTLSFSFLPPKTVIPKNGTYVLVLYGDDKSKVTSPAPAATGSAAPSASPTAASSASASPSATP